LLIRCKCPYRISSPIAAVTSAIGIANVCASSATLPLNSIGLCLVLVIMAWNIGRGGAIASLSRGREAERAQAAALFPACLAAMELDG
jgi:hypothetical protein